MSVPQFIKKLLDILENSNGTIQWNQDGTEFVINDSQKFAQTLLSKHFRHKRFQSFVRQLNMYGFNKICRRKDSINFRHPYFVKGLQDNYILIKRKKKDAGAERVPQNYGIDIIRQVEINCQKYPVIPHLFQKLFKFKNDTSELLKNIRHSVQSLNKELTSKKARQIKPNITKIRQTVNYMQQNSHQLQYNLQKRRQQLRNHNKQSELSLKVSSIDKMGQNEKQNEKDQKNEIIRYKGTGSQKRQKQNKNFSVESFRSIGSFIS